MRCVVLPEYRGYDGIPGGPTYASSALDARAALDFVTGPLGVSHADIVFYGHSLGSAVAAELAGRETPRALVLQSPLSTAREMAARMYLPGIGALWRLMSRIHFDTPTRVRSLRAPCGLRTAITTSSFPFAWAARCSPRPSTRASC